MPAENAVDLRPIDTLDRDIVTLATRINAATYELLVLVREFEERAGYPCSGVWTTVPSGWPGAATCR